MVYFAFCGNSDHKELGSLLPEKSGSTRAIDTCNRCRGYLKTFTKLQGSAPTKIMLDDLASVDLDIAALEQGFKRPAGPGYALNSKVVAKPSLGSGFLARAYESIDPSSRVGVQSFAGGTRGLGRKATQPQTRPNP